MIKREIKEFKLYCDGLSGYPVTIPFSICSALVGAGLMQKKNTGVTEIPVENARIEAVLLADESFFNGRFSYLSVSGLTSDGELYINGSFTASLDGGRRRQLVDVAGALSLGENKIELRFKRPTLGTGLCRAVEFLKFNGAVIDNVRVSERFEDGAAMLDLELDLVGDGDGVRAVATLISGAGQIYYGGFNGGRATVTVKDPLLWWPKGLGVQNIYKLSVNLYGEMEIEDTAELKIGLRALTPDKDSGGVLLNVNRVPFIPMGAVYTPEKNYLPEEEARRTAAFVTFGAMANFNSFVIRAGERLPEDSFFDLCDVHGIAVIYELSELNDAVLDSISRLSHHPSFAPIDIICSDDGGISDIASRLAEAAPSVTYSVFPSALDYFGELSIPTDKTLFSAVAEGERNIFSDSMEAHSGGLSRQMVYSVSENYLYAYDISDLAYLTRLSQARNTEREMAERRLKGKRAVFSSFSADKLISTSALDPMASPKALFYRAQSFFSPVSVSAEVSGGSVSFSASNIGKAAVFGRLEYRVIDAENKLIFKGYSDIDVAESSSLRLFSLDLGEHILSHECDRYLEFLFTEGSHLHCKGVVLFTSPKRFKYEKPEIKADIEGKDRHFHITLSADRYVGSLELSFGEVDAVFSDNYFDITSEMPIKIGVTVNSPVETAKTLKKQLKLRSLYDIGR